MAQRSRALSWLPTERPFGIMSESRQADQGRERRRWHGWRPSERRPAKRVDPAGSARSSRRRTTSFTAQCYVLHDAPAFGSFVRAERRRDRRPRGRRRTPGRGASDPSRRPVARGRDEPDEEAIYRNNPELPEILRTEFTALVVGYRGPIGELRAAAPAPTLPAPRVRPLRRTRGGPRVHRATRLPADADRRAVARSPTSWSPPAFARPRQPATATAATCPSREGARGAAGLGREPPDRGAEADSSLRRGGTSDRQDARRPPASARSGTDRL